MAKEKHQASKAYIVHKMDFEPKTAWVAVKELAGGNSGHHKKAKMYGNEHGKRETVHK